MRKRTVKNRVKPERDRALFERKIAELKASIEQLPPDRRAALERQLEEQQQQERAQQRPSGEPETSDQ